jgi:hypothetical protein
LTVKAVYAAEGIGGACRPLNISRGTKRLKRAKREGFSRRKNREKKRERDKRRSTTTDCCKLTGDREHPFSGARFSAFQNRSA